MFRSLLIVLAALALVASVAAAPAAKATDPKKPESKEQKIASGSLTGKLLSVDTQAKTFVLQITVPTLNETNAVNIRNWNIELAKAPTIANPTDRANHIVKCQQNIAYYQARLYTTTTQNIDLIADEDMKVRLNQPPPKFGDDGKPKRYTQDELKKLKGNSKLPGYPGDWDSVKSEQIVDVTLVRKKDAAKPKPGDPAEKPVVATLFIKGEVKKP